MGRGESRALAMKLIEALNILRMMSQKQGETLRFSLATGMNPLHLKTFLAAELAVLFPAQPIEVTDGLFGDLPGNIDRLSVGYPECVIILIEWSDLDPRLGTRSTARWCRSELSSIVSTVETRASRLQNSIAEASERTHVAVCLPTLPLPPFSYVPRWQSGTFECGLRSLVQSLGETLSTRDRIRLLNSQKLDLDSPLKERLDVEGELSTGFPYRLSHASILAACLAHLAQRPTPKKGLITDLDNTLWKGILGDDGIDGISWDLEHHSQIHAFYQRFLSALASEGVLLGAASKNDPALVEEALSRSDLALPREAIFPVEAHWKAKSQSVARILDAWNVAPDSVIFVDDSPLEVAEVSTAYPEMTCLQFPAGDNGAVYDLTLVLRDHFGRASISEEDSIRIGSIRSTQAAAALYKDAPPSDFFEQLESEVSFDFNKTEDPRALELVNKTNQFNLNGKRYYESSWQKFFLDTVSFLLVASYRDKFGPLGKIAVLAGTATSDKLKISTWVMSCRAFSRRIEHKCLAELLVRFDFDQIELEFVPTDRNGPLREFLCEISGEQTTPRCVMSREELEARLETELRPKEIMHG